MHKYVAKTQNYCVYLTQAHFSEPFQGTEMCNPSV